VTAKAIKSAAPIPSGKVDSARDSVADFIENRLGIPSGKFSLLGSAHSGHRKGVNDLDFGVIAPSGLDILAEKVRRYSHEVKSMPSIGVISFAWVIPGPDGDCCQVDLMVTDNLPFTEWMYRNGHESMHKGAHRNLLLRSIAASAPHKILRSAEGSPLEWESRGLDPKKGLVRRLQSREGKSGQPIKTVKTLRSELITNNPNEIVLELLGPSFTVDDSIDFESVLSAVGSSRFKFANVRSAILDGACQRIQDAGYQVPEPLTVARLASQLGN
jgi:hypothetical protein